MFRSTAKVVGLEPVDNPVDNSGFIHNCERTDPMKKKVALFATMLTLVGCGKKEEEPTEEEQKAETEEMAKVDEYIDDYGTIEEDDEDGDTEEIKITEKQQAFMDEIESVNENTDAKKIVLEDGEYDVGDQFAKGRYRVSSNEEQVTISIFGDDNLITEEVINGEYNDDFIVFLRDKQTVKVNGGELFLEPFNEKVDLNDVRSGMYVVGVDLPNEITTVSLADEDEGGETIVKVTKVGRYHYRAFQKLTENQSSMNESLAPGDTLFVNTKNKVVINQNHNED